MAKLNSTLIDGNLTVNGSKISIPKTIVLNDNTTVGYLASDASGNITIATALPDTNYYAISDFSNSTGTKIATGKSSGTDTPTYDLYAPYATTSQAGVAKVSGVRGSAITAAVGGATSDRYYGVEKDSENKLFVNVPWADNNTWREIQVGGTQKIASNVSTALNFVSQNTNDGDVTFTYDGGIKATAKIPTIPTSFNITVTDDILEGTGGANSVKYAPYTTKSAGKLYTGTTDPSSTDRLNYDGYLYATKLYSAGSEVLTAEADTLATVTGRGASTSTAVTFNGGVTFNDGATFAGTSANPKVVDITQYVAVDVSAGTLKLKTVTAPTTSGGSTYGTGSSGQVLKSNGSTVYWTTDLDTNYYPNREFSSGLQITTTSDSTNYANGNIYVPKATASELGVIKIGYTNSGKKYKVDVDNDGNAYVEVPWTDANTATATDDILDGSNSGTAITYKPYSAQQAKLSFDTSSTAPARTDRLNLNGYFYATKLYSGGNEVYTKPSGGIPASDLAESYYLASNPSGYTSNAGTITGVSVNGTSVATSGVAALTNIAKTNSANTFSSTNTFTNTITISDGVADGAVITGGNYLTITNNLAGIQIIGSGEAFQVGTSSNKWYFNVNGSTGSSGQVLTIDSNGKPNWATQSFTDTNYYPSRSYTSGLQISTSNGSAVTALYVPYCAYNQYGAVKPAYSTTGSATLTTSAASFSDSPTINERTTTSGKYYAVEKDNNGRLYVNVPWEGGSGGSTVTFVDWS